MVPAPIDFFIVTSDFHKQDIPYYAIFQDTRTTLRPSYFPRRPILVQADRYLDKRKADPKLPVDEKWDDAVKSLLNYPAEYGQSSVMTFIFNHNGKIYERDLGKNTAEVGAKMTSFDPVKGWKEVAP